MDPVTALGAAGSVVGIAGFGIQLSQVLVKYASQVWSAQESLEAIVDEISSTTSTLEEIYSFLKQEVANIKRGKPLYLFSQTSLIKVKLTAHRCLVVFWRVEAIISGNWPANIEELLVQKLTKFNSRLDYYTPESPIRIESELTSDPIGLRDRLRWPLKSSKLDKYCKQLQRYQDHLVLLLQVVSLGQQRLKPHPTEEDAKLMIKTYAIISQIASPEQLRAIAFETQAQSQKRRGHSVTPSQAKWPRAPERPHFTGAPTSMEPSNVRSSLYGKNPKTDMNVTRNVTRENSRVPIRPASVTMNNQDYSPGPNIVPQAGKPLGPYSSSDNRQERARHQSASMISQPYQNVSTVPPIQRKATEDVRHGALDRTSEGAAIDGANPKKVRELGLKAPVSSQITAAVRDNVHEPTHQSSQSARVIRIAEPSDMTKPQAARDSVKEQAAAEQAQILPYVICDGGAYQLPVSLDLELKKKLQGSFGNHEKELTEKLAFLSHSQVQTLQDILRRDSGDQVRRLAHLEVVKKPSIRFWHKPTRVMIAFVEGDTSRMPQRVSSVATEVMTSESGHMQAAADPSSRKILPQESSRSQGINSAIDPKAKPPHSEADHLSMAQTRGVDDRNLQNGRKKDLSSNVTPVGPMSVQQLRRIDGPSQTPGLPALQDVTLLGHEAERRAILTEYRVWTIRPFMKDQTYAESDGWNRCFLAEEALSIPQIRNRLDDLDKQPMTVFQKMALLTTSQRLQVVQSIEAANGESAPPQPHWDLRQLDVVRMSRFLKPKYVKAIVVYVCYVPNSITPESVEGRQEHHPDKNQVPIVVHSTAAGNAPNIATSRSEAKGIKTSSNDGYYSTASSEYSDAETENRGRPQVRHRQHERGAWPSTHYEIWDPPGKSIKVKNDIQRTIDRQNDDIASRPSVPPPPSRSARPPIIINNIITDRSSDEDDDDLSNARMNLVPGENRDGAFRYYDRERERSPSVSESLGSRATRQERGYYEHEGERGPSQPDRRGPRVILQERQAREKWQNPEADRNSHPSDYYGDRERYISVDEISRGKYRRAGEGLAVVTRSYPRRPLSVNPSPISPVQRRNGPVKSRRAPRLLGYYTDEELRQRERDRYPSGFDKMPYDPRLSPPASKIRQEAVDQLLLEWTPHYETEEGTGNDDVSGVDSDTSSRGEQRITPAGNTSDPEDMVQEATTNLQNVHTDATKSVKFGSVNEEVVEPSSPAGHVVTEVDEAHPAHDRQITASPEQMDSIEEPSRISPRSRIKRRETTDGNGLEGIEDGWPSSANRAQTDISVNGWNNGTQPFHDSNHSIPRAATFPTPPSQLWLDTDWARQIVEETATVADEDEFEIPGRDESLRPQNPGMVRPVRRGQHPHDTEREDAPRRRLRTYQEWDTHQSGRIPSGASTSARYRPRSGPRRFVAEVPDRTPGLPRRSRTVEFEDSLPTSQGRRRRGREPDRRARETYENTRRGRMMR
ncbi:hypothetical protein F4778DRAFT_544592 [Xylariomycetidae sp. FL2044]|nr:hypothetical protein F4778DRAFT_544592 [Xylariomycetidae sp. FL2044]